MLVNFHHSYKYDFAADEVALRKEAEKRAKRKLKESSRRKLLYKSPSQFINLTSPLSPAIDL